MKIAPTEFKNSYGETTVIRQYVEGTDIKASYDLLREVGWVETDKHIEAFEKTFTAGLTLVGEINGSLECIASSTLGDMVYLDDQLSLDVVAAVVTGMPARRKGLAQMMTAQLMMHRAANGTEVSTLGVFDLGFYDRLGYGTTPYQHRLICDPSDLRVGQSRTPIRLSAEDSPEIHQALLKRKRGHGGCNIYDLAQSAGELSALDLLLCLGYRDTNSGELTHFLLGEMNGEYGPFAVEWLVWDNDEQLRELLALLASLGGQIWVASIPQPRGIEL